MAQTQIVRIVVASPSDVQAERDLLPNVIEELNRGIAGERGLRLELSRWETDAHPGFHSEGPQGLIDPILKIAECDLIIGIFWKRFGTPTPDGKTGTEHELMMAYEAWEGRGRPQIFVYFNQKAYAPNSITEIEQWGKVIEFRNRFPKEGLWWPYKNKSQFEWLVRNHLTNYIRNLAKGNGGNSQVPNDHETQVPATGNSKISADHGSAAPGPTASGNSIFTEPMTINISPPASQQVKQRSQGTVRTGEYRAFNLPHLRNEYFTGREDILQALEDGFQSGRLVQAISGIGGIGKTQTAQEYAYQHRVSYKTILWGKAATREMLTTDFAAMAELLDLPEKSAGNQSEAVKAVRKWLDDNDGWLLILDNADDLVVVREFIPAGGKGHILLTTRAHATGAIAIRHSLEKMSLQEGALFLLRRSKKIAADAPLDGAPSDLRSQAENLANVLDGLPLALDQAAAYIEEKPTTIARYTELYQSMGAKLRARRGDLPIDHPESVSVTFSLGFEKVVGDSAAAADLLRYCAFLEADAIPEEIFSEGAGKLGEAIAAAATLPDGMIDAISEAGRLSLLRYDPESRTVSIHRLVQDVLKDEMNDDLRRVYVERVVRAVNEIFPNAEYSNWPSCDRLIRQAQALAVLIEKYGFDFPEAARLLGQAGYYLNERAQYAGAEPLLARALTIREKALGAEHPSVANSLSNLAGVYHNQGKYAEAEPLYRRAMVIYEKALGAEHPEFATSLNNLAALNYNKGEYAEAELLLARSLAIREKALGAEHPDVANSLNNLAEIYCNHGKYAEAEPLHQRALAIREKALGAEHPDVATSLNNLALLYENQGKYAEAEPLYRRSLPILEKALGAEHPSVATSLNNLALLNHNQGKYAETELLYRRALAIREKALGAEHPDVANSLNNLAGVYHNQGKYAEAEPLYRRSLVIYEKALGAEHPEFATSLNNLAALNYNKGEYAEAEPLYRRALPILEKAFGAEHPDVAISLNNLADIYRNQGKYAEAEPLYRRALAIREKVFGAEHPDVATVLRNYSSLLRATNKESEAEKLENRASIIKAKYET